MNPEVRFHKKIPPQEKPTFTYSQTAAAETLQWPIANVGKIPARAKVCRLSSPTCRLLNRVSSWDSLNWIERRRTRLCSRSSRCSSVIRSEATFPMPKNWKGELKIEVNLQKLVPPGFPTSSSIGSTTALDCRDSTSTNPHFLRSAGRAWSRDSFGIGHTGSGRICHWRRFSAWTRKVMG